MDTAQERSIDTMSRSADLAALRATVLVLQARLARMERRRRLPRRALPLILAALLVALVPLATLAANPFTDLNAGSPHNGNIDAIYVAGITRGCEPDVAYCPNGLVTREEMASFLARTAGLGGNPPVANALTAATAGNAETVGGYTPSALNRVAFSATELTNALPNTDTRIDIVRVTLTIPGTVSQAVAVRGSFNAFSQPSAGIIQVALRQDGAANSLGVGALDFPYQTTVPSAGVSPHSEWVFIAPPGTHTYTLVAQASGMAGPLTIDQVRLVATTHPFGATGKPGTTAIDPMPQGDGRP